jgi:FkbM family methyltransferase
LDIGANIGYYSSYVSPLVRRVYAFEPDPRNLGALRDNTDRCGNVVLVSKAVSSCSGIATLYLPESSSVSSLQKIKHARTIEVQKISIDDFSAENPHLDIAMIKIDIEGHDFEALKGMRSVVTRSQPLIVTECRYSSDLANLCSDWNYAVFSFTRDRKTLLTSFEKIDDDRSWYKMLFLVPARHHDRFEKLAARQ